MFFKFSGLFLFAPGHRVRRQRRLRAAERRHPADDQPRLDGPWAYPGRGFIPTSRSSRCKGCLLAGAILAWLVIPRAVAAEPARRPAAGIEPRRQAKLNRREGDVAVLQRWAGPIVVVLILGGVIAILALNLNLKGRNRRIRVDRPPDPKPSLPRTSPPPERHRQPAGFREYPIGDEVEKNEMLIKAVWLPPVQMEGMDGPGVVRPDPPRGRHPRHRGQSQRLRQGRVHSLPGRALHDRPAGCGRRKCDRPSRSEGKMMPMVARDGLHYGATIEMPRAGHYKLTYAIEPPSPADWAATSIAATGVEPGGSRSRSRSTGIIPARLSR